MGMKADLELSAKWGTVLHSHVLQNNRVITLRDGVLFTATKACVHSAGCENRGNPNLDKVNKRTKQSCVSEKEQGRQTFLK